MNSGNQGLALVITGVFSIVVFVLLYGFFKKNSDKRSLNCLLNKFLKFGSFYWVGASVFAYLAHDRDIFDIELTILNGFFYYLWFIVSAGSAVTAAKDSLSNE